MSERSKPTVSVAAGKGGTGKTLFATSLAVALTEIHPGQVQLIDCDVEEPNADILLHPQITQRAPVNVLVPEVDLDICTRCGLCAEHCQFSAIAVIRDAVLTFPDLCAACGVCAYVCPVDAITEVNRQVGSVAHGSTVRGIDFVQGRLSVGDQRATPVTRAAGSQRDDSKITILDAPPGTACPMQETIEFSDYCILVTEPTPFGLANLEDSVETCRRMGIPCGVVINRDQAGRPGVEDYCAHEGIDVLLRIPEDREIAEAYARGETLADAFPQWHDELVRVYEDVITALSQTATAKVEE